MSGLRKVKGSLDELYDTVFEGMGIKGEPVLLLPLLVQGMAHSDVEGTWPQYWNVYMQSGAVLYLDEASGQALREVLGW